MNQCHDCSAPAQLPMDRLEEAVTPAIADELAATGFAIIDGVFGDDAASALRSEVFNLHQVPCLYRCAMGRLVRLQSVRLMVPVVPAGRADTSEQHAPRAAAGYTTTAEARSV